MTKYEESFSNVRFFVGEEQDYNTLKSKNGLDNCFYYIATFEKNENEMSNYDAGPLTTKLYLRDKLIYSSTMVNDIEKELLEENGSFLVKLNEMYFVLNKESEQLVQGPIKFNSQISVPTIATDDLILNNGKKVTRLPVQDLIAGNLSVENETVSTIKINKSLEFGEETSLNHLPKYVNGEYIFDFNNGELKINKITVEELNVSKKAEIPTVQENAIYKSLQIGNLILSDDGNGNLKITSIVKETE